MANSLNKELKGKIVVLKKEAFKPEYREQYQDEKSRRVKVLGGFGASAITIGKMLHIKFESNGDEASVSGYDVEKIVKEEQ
jgi:hypothetical protein